MKTIFRFAVSPLLFLMPFVLVIAGCQKEALPETGPVGIDLQTQKKPDRSEKINDFYGPTVPFGKGVVRAVVSMDHNNNPVSIGVKISEKVFNELPDHSEEFTLELPNKADKLPFDHIDLGWNAQGHPPFFYEIPHFDIHFYTITESQKMAITDEAKAENLPEMAFWPETFFPTPGYEPYMGKHWLSSEAPELQEGGSFSQTFIYGSYDGDFIFLEPMITLDYLQGRTDESYAISQPEQYQWNDVYFPTTYRIAYDEKKKEYLILLEELIWLE